MCLTTSIDVTVLRTYPLGELVHARANRIPVHAKKASTVQGEDDATYSAFAAVIIVGHADDAEVHQHEEAV